MILFFDCETNGLSSDNSVLSFSALLVDKNTYDVVDVFDRYYFINPGETPNPEALKINGLYHDEIVKRRDNANYATHFVDDFDVYNLIKKADKFIAHNFNFDYKFLDIDSKYHIDKNSHFCTMFGSQYIVNLPPNKGYSEPKWPRLSESIKFFNIDMSIYDGDFHSSLFDCYGVLEVYKCIKQNNLNLAA